MSREVERLRSLLIEVPVIHCSEVANYFIYDPMFTSSTPRFNLFVDLRLQHSSFIEDFDSFNQLTEAIQADAFEFQCVKHNLFVLTIFGAKAVCPAAHLDRSEVIL